MAKKKDDTKARMIYLDNESLARLERLRSKAKAEAAENGISVNVVTNSTVVMEALKCYEEQIKANS